MSLTRAEWLVSASQTLTEAAVDSPRLSAELLLEHVCEVSRLALRLHPEESLTVSQQERLTGLLRRRAEGEPVAYLLGVREFYGRAFRVTPATLIPRPDTECLVEAALACTEVQRFADLGTGSGAIAVTLCAERPEWSGVMVDLSAKALSVACRNACTHEVQTRLLPVRADFTNALFQPASLDLLISNPPYVSREEYAVLSPEVRDFEPVTALVPDFVDSDRDRAAHEAHHHHTPDETVSSEEAGIPNADGRAGLEHLLAVAEEAWIALRPGGVLLLEHGWTQGEPLKVLLERHKWENIHIFQDLAGRDRVTKAQKPPREKTQCC